MMRIYNEDCLETFKRLGHGSVDLILTDPPYNISRPNNFTTMGRAGIDFGEWDKDFNQTDWIKAVTPILKKGGSILIFNCWKNMGEISDCLEALGYDIKDLIRWEKNNPMPRNVKRRYVVDYEYCLWAVKKGAKWTFNKPDDISYLRPKFKAPIPNGKTRIHPTQKPESMIKDLIKIHSNKWDLILDPFAGSGTISKCSSELERDSIGIEIDTTYYNKIMYNKSIGKEINNEKG